jgi:hypothetical protein
MNMSRAVAIAAAADEPGVRRAYAAGLARGATNTQSTAEEERTYGTLRLLTLATLRLPDLFLYAHIVEVLAGDDDHPLPSVAVRAITTTAAGALRLAHRALETHARDVGMADPEVAAAGEALERTFIERTYDQLREWSSRRLTYPPRWRGAAFMSNSVAYLTAAELAAIMDSKRDLHPLHGPLGQGKAPGQRAPRPPLRTRAPAPAHCFGQLTTTPRRHQESDGRRRGRRAPASRGCLATVGIASRMVRVIGSSNHRCEQKRDGVLKVRSAARGPSWGHSTPPEQRRERAVVASPFTERSEVDRESRRQPAVSIARVRCHWERSPLDAAR